ncbi:MAG: AMP-binding protein, partial [Methyloprofundus sp.]
MTSEPTLDLPAEQIRHWSKTTPNVDAIRFLADGETVTQCLSYDELWLRANYRAIKLASMNVRNQPVILAYDAGVEFIVTLLACLVSGVIAVPLPIPNQARTKKRFESVVKHISPSLILCDEKLHSVPSIAEQYELFSFQDEDLEDTKVNETTFKPISANRPAIIQFSSGSTSEPHGIALTHANIMANLHMIHEVFQCKPSSVAVTWLPHHHDMGLFGTLLAPLTKGATVVQMSPETFLRRPLRWIKAIADHQADFAGAPNFGYAICNRRITPEAIAELDLSNWRIAFLGGEPAQPSVLNDFSKLTKNTGFNYKSF